MERKVIRGPDPLGEQWSDHTWRTVNGDGSWRVIWIGSERVLFWEAFQGLYTVYRYNSAKGAGVDPFDKSTSDGTWAKRGLPPDGRLLWLENNRMMWWLEKEHQLLRFVPTDRNDPIQGKPLQRGRWKEVGFEDQLVYLGNDEALWWKARKVGDSVESKSTHASYGVFKLLERNPRPEVTLFEPLVSHNVWDGIGDGHRLYYLGGDRLLVWDKTPRRNGEAPDKDSTRYRIYRMDRSVRGWNHLLPAFDPKSKGTNDERPVAEGLWHGVGEEHELVLLGDPANRALFWHRRTGSFQIYTFNNDFPEVTSIKGVALVRRGGAVRARIVPGDYFEGASPTMKALGARVGLTAGQVFTELRTLSPDNDQALARLYRQVVGGTAPHDVMANTLNKLGHSEERSFTDSNYMYGSRPQYLGWSLDARTPVTVSLTPELQDQLKFAAAHPRVVDDWNVVKRSIEGMEQRIDRIERIVLQLSLWTQHLERRLKVCHQDLSSLYTLQSILELMRTRPRLTGADLAAWKKGDSDFDDVSELEARLGKLIDVHIRDTILQPVHAAAEVRGRERWATELLRELEDESGDGSFRAECEAFARYQSVIPPETAHRIIDVIRNSYTLLLQSHKADEVLTNHVEPALRKAASNLAIKDLPKNGNPAFDRALEAPVTWTPEDEKQLKAPLGWLLTKVSTGLGPVPTLMGNPPGPPSLAIVVFHVAAPLLVARLTRGGEVAGLSARLYRAICSLSNFSAQQQAVLDEVVANGNLRSLLKNATFAKNFQGGVTGTALIGLVNMIAILSVFSDDTLTTRQRVATAFGSIAGLGASVQQLAGAFHAALGKGSFAVAGRALGLVGAVAGATLSAAAAIDAKGENDEVGMFLNGLGAAAGYVLAMQFVVAGGLAGASVAGTLPGAVLLGVGVAIAAGTAIAQLHRTALMRDTHKVARGLLDFYKRADAAGLEAAQAEAKARGEHARAEKFFGALSMCGSKSKDLKEAFDRVEELSRQRIFGHLPFIDPGTPPGEKQEEMGGIERLFTIGLDPDAIAMLVKEDEFPAVRHRLESSKRDIGARILKQREKERLEKEEDARWLKLEKVPLQQ